MSSLWLKMAWMPLKQALKSISISIVLKYVINIAAGVADFTTFTYKDNFIVDVIKGIIFISNHSYNKSIYDISEEIGIMITDNAKKYEDLEKGL